MLEACSSEGEDSLSNGDGGPSNTGYTVNGNTIVIDLNHSSFSSLNSNGWFNFKSQAMLLLKIDSSTYRAFTNVCPHQGTTINGVIILLKTDLFVEHIIILSQQIVQLRVLREEH